jgi:hypothetical protein
MTKTNALFATANSVAIPRKPAYAMAGHARTAITAVCTAPPHVQLRMLPLEKYSVFTPEHGRSCRDCQQHHLRPGTHGTVPVAEYQTNDKWEKRHGSQQQERKREAVANRPVPETGSDLGSFSDRPPAGELGIDHAP